MFNVGPGEIILIAIVLLIAVGPEQLPGVIRRAGRVMSQVRNMTEGLRSDFMAGMDEIEKATDVTAWSQEAVTPSPKPEPTDSEGSQPASSAASPDADSTASPDAESTASTDADSTESTDAETEKPTPPASKNAIAEAARSNGTPAPLPPSSNAEAGAVGAAASASMAASGPADDDAGDDSNAADDTESTLANAAEANGTEADDIIDTSNQATGADPEPSRDGDETEVEGRT